jgi:RND family efflux transporter MFP subunit
MNPSRISSVTTLILAALITTGCEEQQQPLEPALRAVRTLRVEATSTQRQRTLSGLSASSRQTRLSFKVGGTVTEVPVQVGDSLAAGDLVARLDAAPYELIAQQAQAALLQAQASARNMAANYERVKGLYENSNASRNDLDAARAASESSEAMARAAQKALELARLDVRDTRLVTEAACSVASVDLELNENVAVGTPVAVVNCGEGIEVDLSVPGSLIAGIEQGMSADVVFNAVPGSRFSATVTEVGVGSTSNASSFPVTLKVDDPGDGLRPGLAAEVTFSFASVGNQNLQLLPVSAVANDATGSFVYLAVAAAAGQATVERRAVELGDLTERGVEVVSGIAAGDLVVVAGVSVIRPGQTVRLPAD